MAGAENKAYRNLVAWKKGLELAESVYKITEKFPAKEIYGLTSQMRRAVVSISPNIAEGQLRSSRKEFNHFISIALGSCGETDT